MKILIAYDGSQDSQAAIQTAARLFPAGEVVVLTVWESLTEVLARSGGGMAAAPLDFEAIDRVSADAARGRAEEGCRNAQAAGLDSRPLTLQQQTTTFREIIEQAAALDADAIVLGTRGLTGVKSLLLGSVSHGVVQHADRPVVVVPAVELAERRAQRLREHTGQPVA